MSFITDIRNLKKAQPFQGGNNNQRTKLNTLVDGVNGIIDAANKNADPAQLGNGGAGDGNTFLAYISDGGESVLYRIYGGPA